MKRTIEEIIILENINYTQLMAHSLNEISFDDYVSKIRTTKLNQVYATLISCIHSVNDAKILDEDYLKVICNFLDIESINVDALISSLFKRYKEFYLDKPITLSEFKNCVQCFQFIIKTHFIDLDKFSDFADTLKAVQAIKNVELV
jgi:hypothetical protein